MSAFLKLMAELGQTQITHRAKTKAGKVSTKLTGLPVALTRAAIRNGVADGTVFAEATISDDGEDVAEDKYGSKKIAMMGERGAVVAGKVFDLKPMTVPEPEPEPEPKPAKRTRRAAADASPEVVAEKPEPATV
jgi:hypothetical protein